MFRQSPTCFLIASTSGDSSLRKAVEELSEQNGVELISVETASARSAATGDIADAIERADFVIADVTGASPNVLFELGTAYGMRKKMLVMAQETAGTPSDIAGLQVLAYRPEDASRLRQYLSDWLKESASAAR